MSTDVVEQVRQLAAAFDEFVPEVSVEEAIERVDGTVATDDSTWHRSKMNGAGNEHRVRRIGLAAAAVLLFAGLLGALVSIDRGDSGPAASPPPPSATEEPALAIPLGQFVWPAPARGYSTLDDLVTAFTTEVLGWDAFEISDDVDRFLQPQSFTLANSSLDVSVSAVAIPSPDGWGFVQIGDGLEASLGEAGGVNVDFSANPAITSSSVEVRLSDWTTLNMTTVSGRVELADTRLEQLVSVLVIGFDSDGQAIAAIGGQFESDVSAPPTTPTEIDDSGPIAPIDTSVVNCGPGSGGEADRRSWTLDAIAATSQVFDGGAVGIVVTNSVSNTSASVGCMLGDTAALSIANGLGLLYVERVADGVVVALAVPHGRTPVITDALPRLAPISENAQSGFDTYLFSGPADIDLNDYGQSAGVVSASIHNAWQDRTITVAAMSPDLLVNLARSSIDRTAATDDTISPTTLSELSDSE